MPAYHGTASQGAGLAVGDVAAQASAAVNVALQDAILGSPGCGSHQISGDAGRIGEAGGRDFGVSEISFANKTRTV